MTNWISVDERLPETDPKKRAMYHYNVPVSIRVLCACKQINGKVMVKEGYCEKQEDGPFWRIPGSIDSVTHWMYLPEPPTDEEFKK